MTDRINRRTMIRSAAAAGVVGVGALAVAEPAHAASTPPRLVNADGTPVLTPQQFGAVGDGETDDTAAIQAAIDAARAQQNKIVVLPPGIYKVTDTIVVGDHEYDTPGAHLNRFVLRGYGMFGEEPSKIVFHQDGVGILWQASLGGIHGVAFDAPAKTANNVGIRVARTANTDDTDITIVECSFLRFQTAVQSVGRGFLFTKNKVAVCTNGISVSWPTEGVQGSGVHLLPFGLRKWLITDNHFHSNFDAIIFNGAPDGNFRGAIISNNLLDIGRRLFRGSLTNSTISGNVIENGNGNAVIQIDSGGHNLTITGNIIGGYETSPAGGWEPPRYAIHFAGDVSAKNVTISANSFNWIRASAIRFDKSVDKVSITDNSFDNFNITRVATHGAVHIGEDATRLAVLGNIVSANGSGQPAVNVVGTLSESNVVGNTFDQDGLVAAGAISPDSFVEAEPGRFTRLQVAAPKDAAVRVVSTAANGIAGGDSYGGYLVEGALQAGSGPGVKGGVEVVAVNASGSAATNLLCSTSTTNDVVAFQASVAGLIPPADNARDIGSQDAHIRTVYTHATRLHPYTVKTLPPADANAGALIHISDGHDGKPCLAMSDGTSWHRLPLGNAIQ